MITKYILIDGYKSTKRSELVSLHSDLWWNNITCFCAYWAWPDIIDFIHSEIA